MTIRAVPALVLAPLWSNRVLPALDLPLRGRTVANALFATAYTVAFRGRPNWFSAKGLRWGIGSSALVLAGYAAVLAIPPLRRLAAGVEARAPETTTTEWIAVHIPLGTVLAEETIFRATLDPLLAGTPAALLGPLDFGLWHLHPARSAGDPVPATLAATTLAGLLFTYLRHRSTSTTAPALLHLTINTGAALLPRLAILIEAKSSRCCCSGCGESVDGG
ncbi:CPBP family intramembrane glutamic endopeptidase [Nocardia halotolerans]|uniref:CPBP family intramembrane glutamic endopeptidase n=1 Tax=Nocardia halotolerans TaxID=1755878 RepID=A0ABV8VND2_9NOCA